MTTLKVEYASAKLEKLCTDEHEMQRKRADIAKGLKLRIKALESAPLFGDLQTDDPLGRWHELTADHRGRWAGKLSVNQRLLVVPDGSVDADDAASVTVIDIVDYH